MRVTQNSHQNNKHVLSISRAQVDCHVKQSFTRQGFNIATLHNKIQQEAEQIARNPGKDDILARSWPALQCGNSLLSRFQTWLTPTAKKMFPE